MFHLLFALQTAFTLWMLVDAAQRGRFFPWYIIILCPFGEVAYYLAIKFPEDNASHRRRARQRARFGRL